MNFFKQNTFLPHLSARYLRYPQLHWLPGDGPRPRPGRGRGGPVRRHGGQHRVVDGAPAHGHHGLNRHDSALVGGGGGRELLSEGGGVLLLLLLLREEVGGHAVAASAYVL